MRTAILMYHSVFNNQTSKAIVSFHRRYETFCFQDSFQPATTDIRHGKIRPSPYLDICIFLIIRIRIFYKFSPIGCKYRNNFITDRFLEACAPIIAVDYDPGASEVNQLNRIKLMLSTAQKALLKEKEAAPEAAS